MLEGTAIADCAAALLEFWIAAIAVAMPPDPRSLEGRSLVPRGCRFQF
jgi:hypothetical protein